MSASRVMNDVDKLINQKLEASGIIVVANVKPRTPVDTGLLRSAQSYEVTPNSVRIGSPVHYQPYVELGTWRMAAQPHLVPGLKASGGQLNAVWNS